MLEGDVKTPLGEMKKSTVALVAGGLAVVIGVGYYRNRKATNAASAGASQIDPATGYAYGSPEDAAALAAQANYVTPTGGGTSTGGGTQTGTVPGTFTNNAQWTQYAIQQIEAQDGNVDTTKLSEALGLYITGQYADDSHKSLIEQAIAVAGYPPISGSSGYPPGINTTPPVPAGSGGGTPTPTPTHSKSTTVEGLKTLAGAGFSGDIVLDWNDVDGAEYYIVNRDNGVGVDNSWGSSYTSRFNPSGSTHSFMVKPVFTDGTEGAWSRPVTGTAR